MNKKETYLSHIKNYTTKIIYSLSVAILIAAGHYFAVYVKKNEQAWIWVSLFYGLWMLGSILFFLTKKDLQNMFRKASFHALLLIPVIFSLIAFFGVFLRNLHVAKWDYLLLMNIIICLCNPFIEEIYWRGLPSKIFYNKIIQFIFASAVFAIGHPFILGVISRGASGWQTFVGAFILGSCWWFYYNKKGSLRWPVITHFFIDVFGLAAYLLANKLALLM